MPIGGPFGLWDKLLGLRLARRRRAGAPSGLLLISAGGLGDTVLFSLIFQRFKALALYGEGVSLLLRKDAAKMSFLFGNDIIIQAIDFDLLRSSRAYRRQTFLELFDENYRAVISVDHLRHPLLDESLLRACFAAENMAMEARSWPKYDGALARNRRLFSRLFHSGPDRLDKVLRWTRFADWLGGTAQPPPTVRLPAELLPPPASLDAPTLILMPFSAVWEKQSPPSLYGQIIDALGAETMVMIAGAPDDMAHNPEFDPLLQRSNVSFCGLGFKELVPILRAARLVVSVDTAGMHLAVALGAATLCLASNAYAGEIVPYAPEISPSNGHFIMREMDCAGCLGHCIHEAENGMYPCVAGLSSDEVVATVQALWQEAGDAA